MNKGLRGCWSNTPSHLSLIPAVDFRIRTFKVNILHASVIFGRLVLGEVISKIFSYFLLVEAIVFFA